MKSTTLPHQLMPLILITVFTVICGSAAVDFVSAHTLDLAASAIPVH